MQPFLLGLTGDQGAGKDLVAALIGALCHPAASTQHGRDKIAKYMSAATITPERVGFMYAGVEIHSYANALAQVCAVLTGAEDWRIFKNRTFKDTVGIYGMTNRALLQKVGVVLRQHVNMNVWVDAMFRGWDEKCSWVVPDVRFPNEVTAIQIREGVVYRVVRPGHLPDRGHISDIALDKHEFPVILNPGPDRPISELIDNIVAAIPFLQIPAPALAPE
jgi:hypothetical protein